MELQIIPIDWMNRYTIILGSDRATLMVLVMLSVVITLCVMGVRVGIVSHVLKEKKKELDEQRSIETSKDECSDFRF
jgi:NhaP-type Na+/H+ or K+/H+ antiporter